jgi:excinuclease ABC subunit A
MSDVEIVCPMCNGQRFTDEALQIKFKDKNISDVLKLTVKEALSFFDDQPKMLRKLEKMDELGLGYLEIGQRTSTLSGGELQRLNLARELSKLKGGKHNLYILDEPTTGLHLHDVSKLLMCLRKIVDAGHSIILIEHHMNVVRYADYIIDLGPEGGNNGGYVLAAGTPEEISRNKDSVTGKYIMQKN